MNDVVWRVTVWRHRWRRWSQRLNRFRSCACSIWRDVLVLHSLRRVARSMTETTRMTSDLCLQNHANGKCVHACRCRYKSQDGLSKCLFQPMTVARSIGKNVAVEAAELHSAHRSQRMYLNAWVSVSRWWAEQSRQRKRWCKMRDQTGRRPPGRWWRTAVTRRTSLFRRRARGSTTLLTQWITWFQRLLRCLLSLD